MRERREFAERVHPSSPPGAQELRAKNSDSTAWHLLTALIYSILQKRKLRLKEVRNNSCSRSYCLLVSGRYRI